MLTFFFKYIIQQSELRAKVPCISQTVYHFPLQCSPTVLIEAEGIGLEKNCTLQPQK